MRGRDEHRLAVASSAKPLFISGIDAERLDQREADEVREADLAAAAAGEVVVDDDAVVDEQLGGHRAHAGRGRAPSSEASMLVTTRAAGAAQRGDLLGDLGVGGSWARPSRRAGWAWSRASAPRGPSEPSCGAGLLAGGAVAVAATVGVAVPPALAGAAPLAAGAASLLGRGLGAERAAALAGSRRGLAGSRRASSPSARWRCAVASVGSPTCRRASSPRRTPTRPGRPSSCPGGTARTARRPATRWGRRQLSGSSGRVVWVGHGGYASFVSVVDDGHARRPGRPRERSPSPPFPRTSRLESSPATSWPRRGLPGPSPPRPNSDVYPVSSARARKPADI